VGRPIIDKIHIWLYASAMSDYGPDRERTSFDFYGAYGDEQEIVYSDGRLRTLFENSPAFLVRHRDVAAKAGDFAEDDETDRVLRQVNDNPVATTISQGYETVLVRSALNMFAVLDRDPYAQCTLPELSRRIREVQRAYVETLDPVADREEVTRMESKIRKLEAVVRLRQKHLDNLQSSLTQITLQQRPALDAAVEGVRRHIAAQAAENNDSAA
jgi:hypothetical protein